VYHRQSTRLPGYDYSQNGFYFVTICTWEKEWLFGEIKNKQMCLSAGGLFARSCLLQIPNHFPYGRIDAFVIMPNHIHTILVIDHNVGANDHLPLPHGTSKTLGSIVRGFKIGVSMWYLKEYRRHHIWQRNYYEHVIRNEKEYWAIKRYIEDNPMNWENDELY
jgi:putative transposase